MSMALFALPSWTTREKVRTSTGVGRYHNIRFVILSLAMLLVIFGPAFNLWHIDIYTGKYWVLGKSVSLVYAIQAFTVGFIAINVVILIVNAIFGRFLCGWFCPVATLNRVGEWGRRHLPKWGRVLIAGLIGAATGLGMITWMFDPVHVFDLTAWQLAIFLAVWGFLTISVAGQILWLGHNFCLGLCPSGIYFSLTSSSARGGIHLVKGADCTDCNVCAKACPMGLDPVRLLEKSGEPLAYPFAATDFDRCIRCGDCIEACDKFGNPNQKDWIPPIRMGIGKRDVLNADLNHIRRTQKAKPENSGKNAA